MKFSRVDSVYWRAMPTPFEISDAFIAEQNKKTEPDLREDFEMLGRQLSRRKIDINTLVGTAQAFAVARI